MCIPGIGGGSKGSQTSTTTVKNEIPAWIEQAGKDLYARAQPLSSREYPVYADPRIADYNPDQIESFQRTRENVGSWAPLFMQSVASASQAGQPIGEQDIASYMNPYTQSVIDATTGQINRQFDQETIARNASMAQRGSYLNEDRRELIDQEAETNKNRVIAETIAALNLQGFNNAMGQGNIQKDRDARTAAMFSNLAPQLQGLGYTDAAAVGGIGATQEAKEQQGLNLQYEDFLRQFYFPQEQTNWLGGTITGIPYATSQTTTARTPVAGGNPLSSILGLGISAAGMFGGGGAGGIPMGTSSSPMTNSQWMNFLQRN